MTERPGLSICMMVRDEAAVLQRCLDSVKGLYDELCVVDTGSTDGTVAIAKRNGAIVEECGDCNDETGRIVDFSRPRNVALAMARREWVLQIDADEVLREGHEALRAQVEWGTHDSVATKVRSDGAEWYSIRLFRRSAAGRYVSPIHEYVELTGSSVKEPAIVIENVPDKRGKESSFDRNVRLALATLAEDPDQGRVHHYLGNEYRKAQRYHEAIQSYEAALRAGDFKSGLFYSAYYLGACHMILGDWQSAAVAGRRAIAIDPAYAEGHCLLGDSLYCSGRLAEARHSYEAALRCEAPPARTMFPTRAESYGPHPERQLRRIADALRPASKE
jgi:glycosyltransferase involved in cell wall biosynthesis